jgi:hypothetical protein
VRAPARGGERHQVAREAAGVSAEAACRKSRRVLIAAPGTGASSPPGTTRCARG